MFDSLKKRIADFVMDCFDTADKMDNEATPQGNDACSCGCTDEKSQMPVGHMTPEQEKEMIENWVPPARFCIRASGMDYWCDDWKSGPMGAVDITWTQKIKGEEKTVVATIFENSFTIVDYETTMTPETFDHIKKKNIDYVIQMEQEARLAEDAKKEREKEYSTPPVDANYISYN